MDRIADCENKMQQIRIPEDRQADYQDIRISANDLWFPTRGGQAYTFIPFVKELPLTTLCY